MKGLREKLAALAHEQWSGWMRYLFLQGSFKNDGSWVMPAWAVERWCKQMDTPYSELSQKEKNSDRKEADKFIAVINDYNTLHKWAAKLEKALEGQKRGSCWCEVGIDNPMMSDTHSEACKNIKDLLTK